MPTYHPLCDLPVRPRTYLLSAIKLNGDYSTLLGWSRNPANNNNQRVAFTNNDVYYEVDPYTWIPKATHTTHLPRAAYNTKPQE